MVIMKNQVEQMDELGKIYGNQWRRLDPYLEYSMIKLENHYSKGLKE